MPLVKKAYEEWNGELPQETAFPAKLRDLLDVSWQDVQKHSESVRNLLKEVFLYIKSASDVDVSKQRGDEAGGEGMSGSTELGTITINARVEGFAFMKTLPFTESGFVDLEKLVEFLKTQTPKQKKDGE